MLAVGLIGLVGVAALSAWTPIWVCFVPRVGVWPLYRLWPIRVIGVILTLGTAATLCVLRPSAGTITALSFTGVFAVMAFVANPRRILPTLIDPPRRSAAEADLADEALVLGIEIDGAARAWAVELVVPHHLIHDRVGDTPLLAAW